MAVDTNVLIFTRIKKELANGIPPQQTIDAGYLSAFPDDFGRQSDNFLVAVVLFGEHQAL